MNIVIVTDAWTPQVNGVVRTLQSVGAELIAMGHRITVISPDLFPSLPCPTYPEIRLAFAAGQQVGRRIAAAGADADVCCGGGGRLQPTSSKAIGPPTRTAPARAR